MALASLCLVCLQVLFFFFLFATNLYKNMISHMSAYEGFRTVLAVIGGATCQLSEILQAIFPYASCLNNRQSKQGKEKKVQSRKRSLDEQ